MRRPLYRIALAGLIVMILSGCLGRGQVGSAAFQQETAPTTDTRTAWQDPEPEPEPETEPERKPDPEPPEPEADALVRVLDYIPGIYQDLRYAGEDNFTGKRIYPFRDAYLRYGTVKKLKLVQEELEGLGMGLLIWDGFRPTSAQFTLWEVCPNPNYVANPHRGYSSHSRGNTVDVTLVDKEGQTLEMPTGFDDFTARADRDYTDCTPIQAAHALALETVMERHGFVGYFGEWWHFTDADSYPVEDSFVPPEEP